MWDASVEDIEKTHISCAQIGEQRAFMIGFCKLFYLNRFHTLCLCLSFSVAPKHPKKTRNRIVELCTRYLQI